MKWIRLCLKISQKNCMQPKNIIAIYLKKKLGKCDIHWKINDNNYKIYNNEQTQSYTYNLIIL